MLSVIDLLYLFIGIEESRLMRNFKWNKKQCQRRYSSLDRRWIYPLSFRRRRLPPQIRPLTIISISHSPKLMNIWNIESNINTVSEYALIYTCVWLSTISMSTFIEWEMFVLNLYAQCRMNSENIIQKIYAHWYSVHSAHTHLYVCAYGTKTDAINTNHLMIMRNFHIHVWILFTEIKENDSHNLLYHSHRTK